MHEEVPSHKTMNLMNKIKAYQRYTHWYSSNSVPLSYESLVYIPHYNCCSYLLILRLMVYKFSDGFDDDNMKFQTFRNGVYIFVATKKFSNLRNNILFQWLNI